MIEFQSILECTESPCTYCRTDTHRIELKRSYGEPFKSFDEAFEYGKEMRKKVYGSSHKIIVESRYVSSWTSKQN